MNDDTRGLIVATAIVGLGVWAFVPGKAVVPTPVPKPAPAVVVPVEPPKAKREWAPLPKLHKPAPIMKERKRKATQKAKQKQRGISASQCRRLKNGIDTYGLAAVRVGAPTFGYTSAQVDWARTQCRI